MTGQNFDRRLILACLIFIAVGLVWASTSLAQGPAQAQQDDRSCGTNCSRVQSGAQEPQESQEKEKPPDQQVSGEVMDKDGKPVNKAEVHFEGPKKDKVWTDGHGKFSFSGPPGTYVVTVKADGLETKFKEVKIEDNHLNPEQLVIKPQLP